VVNLRYHIVSIVAVFLALGIGILMGSTVVDRATVDFLRGRLDGLERARDTARGNAAEIGAERDQLRDLQEQFAVEGRAQLVRGHLTDVPVLLVGARGMAREPVEELTGALQEAGARLQGTLWLTGKLGLDQAGDRAAVGQALAAVGRPVTEGTADALQRAVVEQLAQELAAVTAGTPGASAPLWAALQDGGLVERDDAPEGGPPVPDGQLALPGSRVVVLAGPGAAVPNDRLAVPLASALARARPAAVLAAQAGDPPEAEQEEPVAPVFVAALRGDDEVKAALASVDNLDSLYGQLAVVLALEDLAAGRTVGHYGVGPGAQRLLPAAP
jgi:hypothetical protein